MTKNEIMNAWKSFIEYPHGSDERFVTTTSAILFAEHVVSIAVEAEREACAKLCEEEENGIPVNGVEGTWCADAIRARGTT